MPDALALPGFEPVLAACSLLSGLTVPWWVGGGWAIDLAVGRVTREHADVDLVLLERDEHALRSDLHGVELALVDPDGRQRPWPAGQRLVAGPDSVRLGSARLPLATQVLFASAVAGTWVYHRGNRSLARPLAAVTLTRGSVPFMAPEVVLLMKSQSDREKDTRDFEAALPVLGVEQRAWLRDAVDQRWRSAQRRASATAPPGLHPWLQAL